MKQKKSLLENIVPYITGALFVGGVSGILYSASIGGGVWVSYSHKKVREIDKQLFLNECALNGNQSSEYNFRLELARNSEMLSKEKDRLKETNEFKEQEQKAEYAVKSFLISDGMLLLTICGLGYLGRNDKPRTEVLFH